jgi:hypothetical protein
LRKQNDYRVISPFKPHPKKDKVKYKKKVTNQRMTEALWRCLGECKKYFIVNKRIPEGTIICPVCGSNKFEIIPIPEKTSDSK